MMGEVKTLLSRESLAVRWEVSTQTIIKYENDGVISRVPGIPSPRYKISEIEKIEGIEENPLSPIERRRLEKENKQLREELRNINKIILNISIQCKGHKLIT